MVGDNFSSWYNQNGGSFYAEYILGAKSTGAEVLKVSDGTVANTIAMRYASGSQAQFSVAVGGVTQANLAPSGYSSANKYKRAIAFVVNSFQQAINGTTPTAEDTSGTLPTVSVLDIGSSAGDNILSGHIQKIAYFPRRLSNSELQSLTAATPIITVS
jgi:hypothetical protein